MYLSPFVVPTRSSIQSTTRSTCPNLPLLFFPYLYVALPVLLLPNDPPLRASQHPHITGDGRSCLPVEPDRLSCPGRLYRVASRVKHACRKASGERSLIRPRGRGEREGRQIDYREISPNSRSPAQQIFLLKKQTTRERTNRRGTRKITKTRNRPPTQKEEDNV